LLCAALVSVAALAGPVSQDAPVGTSPHAHRLTFGATGLVYAERSEPELDGTTVGGAVVFAARVHPRISVYVEGGRARFYGDDQPGHRDFFLSGLVGIHPRDNDTTGLVILAGPTLLHSERHKFFGGLATNKAALTLGAEYVWPVRGRITMGLDWRTDLSAGMTVHRPGFSVRVAF
jgi:hypothetical protein